MLARGAVLAVLTGLLLWLGVYPAPVIDLIHRMSATLIYPTDLLHHPEAVSPKDLRKSQLFW